MLSLRVYGSWRHGHAHMNKLLSWKYYEIIEKNAGFTWDPANPNNKTTIIGIIQASQGTVLTIQAHCLPWFLELFVGSAHYQALYSRVGVNLWSLHCSGLIVWTRTESCLRTHAYLCCSELIQTLTPPFFIILGRSLICQMAWIWIYGNQRIFNVIITFLLFLWKQNIL